MKYCKCNAILQRKYKFNVENAEENWLSYAIVYSTPFLPANTRIMRLTRE
jgi:hypothetical protein